MIQILTAYILSKNAIITELALLILLLNLFFQLQIKLQYSCLTVIIIHIMHIHRCKLFKVAIEYTDGHLFLVICYSFVDQCSF